MTKLIPLDAAIACLTETFKGIGEREIDALDGWWETSSECDFGADRLNTAIVGLQAIPTIDPAAIREAARLLLSDLARALDTDMAADGIEAGKRWSAVSDAMEAAPTAMDHPTPIQMIRAGLQSLTLIGEKK